MKKLVVVVSLLTMILGLSAFQCSSTELTSAKLYIQQNNLSKAQESLEAEVSKNPKSDEGYYLLGYVYGEQKDYNKMLECFDKSAATSNKFAAEIDQSKKFHWAENYNRGVSLFNKATRTTDVDSAKIVFSETIKTFEDAILCQPDSADSYMNLVYCFLNTGDYAGAIPVLENLIKIEKSPEAYARLGEIYITRAVARQTAFRTNKIAADSVLSKEEFNKAIVVLEEARTHFPEDSAILEFLANSYIGADKLDVAMQTFKSVVVADPESAGNRYNYGSLLLNAEMFEEAVPEFEKALSIDPTMTNAIYNLAVTYVKWGARLREQDIASGAKEESQEYKKKFEAALPYLEKYTSSDEGIANRAMWELLGKVYLNLGMTEKSQEAYEKADKL